MAVKDLEYYTQKIKTLVTKTIEGDFSILLDYSLQASMLLSGYLILAAPLRLVHFSGRMRIVRTLTDLANGANDVWEFNNAAFLYVYFLIMTWIIFFNNKMKKTYHLEPPLTEGKTVAYWVIPFANLFLAPKTIFLAKKNSMRVTQPNEAAIKMPSFYINGWIFFWLGYALSLTAYGFFEKHIRYPLVGASGLMFCAAFGQFRKMVADMESYNSNTTHN